MKKTPSENDEFSLCCKAKLCKGVDAKCRCWLAFFAFHLFFLFHILNEIKIKKSIHKNNVFNYESFLACIYVVSWLVLSVHGDT